MIKALKKIEKDANIINFQFDSYVELFIAVKYLSDLIIIDDQIITDKMLKFLRGILNGRYTFARNNTFISNIIDNIVDEILKFLHRIF